MKCQSSDHSRWNREQNYTNMYHFSSLATIPAVRSTYTGAFTTNSFKVSCLTSPTTQCSVEAIILQAPITGIYTIIYQSQLNFQSCSSDTNITSNMIHSNSIDMDMTKCHESILQSTKHLTTKESVLLILRTLNETIGTIPFNVTIFGPAHVHSSEAVILPADTTTTTTTTTSTTLKSTTSTATSSKRTTTTAAPRVITTTTTTSRWRILKTTSHT